VVLVASDEMKSYFGDLEKRADDCYNLVSKARKAGFDPALEPEIPRAKDLAERVEAQVGRYHGPRTLLRGLRPKLALQALLRVFVRLPRIMVGNPRL